jgi:hypothetical protein
MINPETLAGLAGGRVTSGEMASGDVAELRKALEAGYGTDVSALSGGGALRIQSLEKTMMSTIQENKHFALFNELAKGNAGATVDEWTEQSGIGGFLGGSTNTETGSIDGSTGQYNRRVGMVKYLMTRREVSFVSTLGNNLVQAEAVEAQNGALQLLTDAEYLSFEGDSSVVPTEFDGIAAQIASLDSTDHLIDAEGESLASIHLVDQAAATIAGYGNFGTPTHLFMSQLNQSDFNTNLDPAFRVALTDSPNALSLGAPVVGIRTSWGDIKTKPDVFIRDERQQRPFEIEFPAVAAKNTFQPAAVAPVAAAGGTDSKWGAAHAGNYYYAVAGVNAKGQSNALVSEQVAVASGDEVTITITRSATAEETGYVIYRGRLNGSNELTDLRVMTRVAVAGATTTFVDKNRKIPGTTKAYILNMAPGAQAINWRQLLPMTKFALYPTVSAVVPWAQLLFGYLRIAKRKHHVVIENIVPSGAVWKPFA